MLVGWLFFFNLGAGVPSLNHREIELKIHLLHAATSRSFSPACLLFGLLALVFRTLLPLKWDSTLLRKEVEGDGGCKEDFSGAWEENHLGSENPLALDMARFWDVTGTPCALKNWSLHIENWMIFWFWGYICSFAFCKINGNKEKRVFAYSTYLREKWGRKLIWLSDFAWDFCPLFCLSITWLLFWWVLSVRHYLTGQTSINLPLGKKKGFKKTFIVADFGSATDTPCLGCRIWNCCMGWGTV